MASHAFTLREQCGHDWTNELLWFPLQWSLGEQKNSRLVLAQDGKAVATQITDVTLHADGSLAAAKAWCRANLPAGKKTTFGVKPAKSPDHSDRPFWRLLPTGEVEAGNRSFAVRLPASGTYCPCEAPGPIVAVRPAGSQWLAHGRLTATQNVVIKTELMDSGPLFIRWTFSAHYETRPLISIECTLYAGEDFVRLDERTSCDSDMDFILNCFPGLAPDRLITKGGGEHIHVATQTLDYGRAEPLAVVDFNSGHHQMSLTWLGVYRDGQKPFVGIVELDGWQWTNLAQNRLHLECSPPGELSIRSPLRGGRKIWALVCSQAATNVVPPAGSKCIHLSDIHQRWAEIPLQKVKDWVLDWPDREPARPFLQCDGREASGARAKIKKDPRLLAAYQEWAAAVDRNEPDVTRHPSALTTLYLALGEERFAQAAVAALVKEVEQWVGMLWTDGMLMRLIIFHGRSMKMWLQAYDILKPAGFIDAKTDRRLRRDFAFLAYTIADPEFFPKHNNLADHNDPAGFFHGLGDRIGDAMCPPNFHTEYFTTYGMMGCCFRSHPMAAAWRQEALELAKRQLQTHYYDSGGYVESPNYHEHSFTMMVQTALALRRAGHEDLFQNPRLKPQFEWFCQMQTPPVLMNETAKKLIRPWHVVDADRDRFAMLPSNGNTGHDCSDQILPVELAVGAAIYQDIDPILASRCMTTWRRAGRPIHTHYDDLTFLLLSRPDLAGPKKLALHSTLLAGTYAVFRGNPETPEEVYVLTKNGTATHHNDFDEGGFTIWAYGSPIASDFGYHGQHDGKTCGTGDTWKHNCVEFDGKSSGYLGIEQTRPPEKWVSTPLADLLVSYIPITNFRGPYMSYMDLVPAQPIEYRRYTLFVKPHYLLVFDSILECSYSHKWWLHAQANHVRVEGPKVRFAGKFGVDLQAQFITPESPAIEAGQWGVMKHIFAAQAHARDWRVFVAPCKPAQNFEVSSQCGGRVVHVKTPDYSDTIFLAHFPFDFAADGISFEGKAGVVRRRTGRSKPQIQLLDGVKLKA